MKSQTLSTLMLTTLLLGACTATPEVVPTDSALPVPPLMSPSPLATAPATLSMETPVATIRVGEVIGVWIASGSWDFDFSPEGIVELVPEDPATPNQSELGLRALAPGVVVVTATRQAGDQPTERYTVTVLP